MRRLLRFFDENPVYESPGPVAHWLALSLYLNLSFSIFFLKQPFGFLLAVLLFLRTLLARLKYFVPEAVLSILTITIFISIPLFFRRDFISFDYLGAVIASMVLLRSMRLKSSGDARYLLILLILLSSAFPLANDSPWVSVSSMLLLTLDVGCLLRLHARGLGWRELLGSARMFLLALAYAAPMMFLLFFLFQNSSRHHSGYGNGEHESGLSTHLEPGEVANLAQRSDTAYRVKSTPELELHRSVFWRVATLSQSNGLEWDKPDFEEGHLNENDVPESCLVFQEIETVGEESTDYPVALDPQVNLLRLFPQKHQAASSICPISSRRQLDAKSKERYLKLDFLPSEKEKNLVVKLTKNAKSNLEMIRNITGFLASGKFRLTLQPKKVSSGSRGLDEFLFQTQEGFCEHYAASLAALLRIAGIPARVVIGYRDGTYNSLGGYWRLAYSDAHAWTEAWDGTQWRKSDVTELLPPVSAKNTIWTRWGNQLLLISDGLAFFGKKAITQLSEAWTTWKGRLLCAGLITLFGFAIYLLRFKSFGKTTEIEKTFHILSRSLARRGLVRGNSEGFESYHQRIRSHLHSDDIQTIDEFFETYLQFRYGKVPPDSEKISNAVRKLPKRS